MSSVETALATLDHTSGLAPKPLKRRYVLEVEIPTRRRTVKPKPEDTPTAPSSDDGTTASVLHPIKRLCISNRKQADAVTYSASSKYLRPAKKVGKSRAIARLSSRSRSRSHSSTYTRPSFTRACSVYSTKSGISAGPSGAQAEVHRDDQLAVLEDIQSQIKEDEAMAIDLGLGADGRPKNLDILAVAAEFLNDEDRALQMFPDGHATSVPAMGELPKIKDEAVDLKQTYAVEESAARSREEVEEPECAICMEEISGVVNEAEKEGKGGIGGGLAMWACDLPNCGALYCITCALQWANQAFERNAHPACPKCTRPTQVLVLRKQAFAYDKTIRYPFKAVPLLGPETWRHVVPQIVAYRQTLQGQAAGATEADSRALADWFRIQTTANLTPEQKEEGAIITDGYTEMGELSWAQFVNVPPVRRVGFKEPGEAQPIPAGQVNAADVDPRAASYVSAREAVRHIQGGVPQPQMDFYRQVQQLRERFQMDGSDRMASRRCDVSSSDVQECSKR